MDGGLGGFYIRGTYWNVCMLTYIVRQILYAIIIILGVMTVTFVIIRVIPGDPARLIQGQHADPQAIESIRAQWKLDRPLLEQYGNFLLNAAKGDLGESYIDRLAVTERLLSDLGWTIVLSISALAIASVLGIAIGVVSAWKPNTLFDSGTMIVALLGISVPVFVVGIVVKIFFIQKWQLFPGIVGTGQNPFDLRYLTLPMLALAARPLSIIARITRSSMLDVLSQDYIRTARAKGLAIRTTILRHGLRNALNPVITTISAWLASTLAGTLFIEQMFNRKGIGQTAFLAISQRDFPVIQGVVLLTAIIFVVINLLVDIIYAYLDPKVRLS